jgi:hypothetical protein
MVSPHVPAASHDGRPNLDIADRAHWDRDGEFATHAQDAVLLHLGHMQLTYQLWQGGQGKPSPYWVERLPTDEGH